MQAPTPPQPQQPPNPRHPDFYDDEIDLIELWNVIWQGKWIIAGITTLFAATAVIVSLMLPNIYRSEVLLAPASSDDKSALASLAGQFGGLASLAGIDMGGSSDQAALALEVLKSRVFIGNFIQKHELAVPLMAARGWDSDTNEWAIDPDIYNSEEQKWVRDVSPPKKVEPSALEMHEVFIKDVLTISEDKKTGLVNVGLELMSPVAAETWLSLLIQDLNEYMRTKDILEAQKSINYLSGQLNKTSVTEMQRIFYQLIEQQTKKMMLAEVRDEYIFKTVDPAIAPEKKYKPKRALICILATLIGGMLGIVVVFIKNAIESRARTESVTR